uniref:Apolipoprotein D n=1 Tax=Culicoides sonorensis TaxID=179676 RepID=A0A336LB91_CULSO
MEQRTRLIVTFDIWLLYRLQLKCIFDIKNNQKVLKITYHYLPKYESTLDNLIKLNFQFNFFFSLTQKMGYIKSILLLFTFYLLSNVSALRLKGQCDEDREVVQDFQVVDYLGVWYEQERYEQTFQIEFDCVTASYSLNDNGTVRVLNENLMVQNEFLYTSVLGWAIPSFPDEEPLQAKLNVSFFGQPNDRVNYQVLATDYRTYTLIWSCSNIDGETKDESMWLLSRTPILDPRPVKVELLIDLYFDRELIRKTLQGPKCTEIIEVGSAIV